MIEAKLWKPLSEDRVQCDLCAHRCVIQPGERGTCYVRENRDGTLYTLVYERVIAEFDDPIEKKPLFHFYPGSQTHSIATPGCNFSCRWCQNASISQEPRNRNLIVGRPLTPKRIVQAALESHCRSISYTYSEPTVFFEYAYDTARLARQAGLANVFVTNGYLTPEALEMLHPYLDAASVDLKAFKDETYRTYIGGQLQPVLDTLKLMKQMGIWVEVTTLVIPGVNDSSGELREAAQFIAEELGPETPWHVSRFFPAYKMTNIPTTSESILTRALEIGEEAGLHYVYAGNSHQNVSTFCHACGELLIERAGHVVLENRITPKGTCPSCGAPVAGIGLSTT